MAGRCVRHSLVAVVIWSALLPLVGCYASVPVLAGVSPLPGDATVVLTAAGSGAVQRALGDGVKEIDGTIRRVTADSLEMTVSGITTVSRERLTQTGTTVVVARAMIERVDARRFSRRRSVALVAALVAMVVVVLGASSIASASGEGLPGTIQP